MKDVLIVVLQGLAALAFIRLARSFGAYAQKHEAAAKALHEVQETNLALQESNIQILVAIREGHRAQSTKGAA